MSVTETEPSPREESVTPIEVRMLVTPPETVDCPPEGCDSATVKQKFRMDACGDRPCNMVLETEGSVTYERFEACEDCPCFLLTAHDCIAELLEVRNSRLLYSVTLPDREGLPPLVDSLRDAGATVTVTRILSAGTTDEEPPTLTDKQHETVQMAVEAGYYERPRRATLDDIASELGITTSAASQRLNSVKRRLIDTYITQFESGHLS